MVFFATSEAEFDATDTLDNVFNWVFISLDEVLAIWLRAPSNVFVVVGELFAVPLHIFIRKIIILFIIPFTLQILNKLRMRHRNIAMQLLTFSKYTQRSFTSNFLFQVFFPTIFTKLMVTFKTIRDWFWIIWIKLTYAYATESLVIFSFWVTSLRILYFDLFIKFYSDCKW